MTHHIIEDLRSIRKDAGVNQVDMANKIGIARASLSMWEVGKASPLLDSLITYANACGLTLELAESPDHKPLSPCGCEGGKKCTFHNKVKKQERWYE